MYQPYTSLLGVVFPPSTDMVLTLASPLFFFFDAGERSREISHTSRLALRTVFASVSIRTLVYSLFLCHKKSSSHSARTTAGSRNDIPSHDIF